MHRADRRAVTAGDDGERIDDLRRGLQREEIDDAHVGGDRRVGLVDDSRRHLAAVDQREGGAHVAGLGKLAGDLVPEAQRLQRLTGVNAGGDVVGVSQREAAVAEQGGEVEVRRQAQLQARGRRRHQHQTVGQQAHAAVGDDQVLPGQVVHPGHVGREEEIGWRALGDLSRQGGGGRDHRPDRAAGLRRIGGGDLVDRVGGAGGGEQVAAAGATAAAAIATSASRAQSRTGRQHDRGMGQGP